MPRCETTVAGHRRTDTKWRRADRQRAVSLPLVSQSWENSPVSAEANQGTLSTLRTKLTALTNEHLPADDAARLSALARPAVLLAHGERESDMHLGGGARLEPGQEWPSVDGRFLALLVVLDLEEVSRFVVDVDLPAQGYLNFFYDAEEQSVWGFEPGDNRAWRVLYAASASAIEIAPPKDAPSFPLIWLVAEQALTLPGWEEPVASPLFPSHAPPRNGLLGRRADKKDQTRRDAYFAVQDAWRTGEHPDHIGHQIGGWPVLQQGPIWRECDLVSQGYPLGTSDQFRAAEQAGVPDTQTDWQLLLQVESDDDAGWMWGDVGALYYTVRSSEPAERKFDHGWMILQCG